MAFAVRTDSNVDPQAMRRFLIACQTARSLTIGELWVVAIILRIALVENLRRLTDQMTRGRRELRRADAMADRILVPDDIGRCCPMSSGLAP